MLLPLWRGFKVLIVRIRWPQFPNMDMQVSTPGCSLRVKPGTFPLSSFLDVWTRCRSGVAGVRGGRRSGL